jgi:hypothetical protein
VKLSLSHWLKSEQKLPFGHNHESVPWAAALRRKLTSSWSVIGYQWWSGGIIPCIPNLETTWKLVVKFTTRPNYVRESYLGVHWTRGLLGGPQCCFGSLLLSGNQIRISRSLIPQPGHIACWNIPATSASDTNSISQLTFHFIFGQPSKWIYSKGPPKSCRHMLLSSPSPPISFTMRKVNLKDHPLSGVCEWFCKTFAATQHTCRSSSSSAAEFSQHIILFHYNQFLYRWPLVTSRSPNCLYSVVFQAERLYVSSRSHARCPADLNFLNWPT